MMTRERMPRMWYTALLLWWYLMASTCQGSLAPGRFNAGFNDYGDSNNMNNRKANGPALDDDIDDDLFLGDLEDMPIMRDGGDTSTVKPVYNVATPSSSSSSSTRIPRSTTSSFDQDDENQDELYRSNTEWWKDPLSHFDSNEENDDDDNINLKNNNINNKGPERMPSTSSWELPDKDDSWDSSPAAGGIEILEDFVEVPTVPPRSTALSPTVPQPQKKQPLFTRPILEEDDSENNYFDNTSPSEDLELLDDFGGFTSSKQQSTSVKEEAPDDTLSREQEIQLTRNPPKVQAELPTPPNPSVVAEADDEFMEEGSTATVPRAAPSPPRNFQIFPPRRPAPEEATGQDTSLQANQGAVPLEPAPRVARQATETSSKLAPLVNFDVVVPTLNSLLAGFPAVRLLAVVALGKTIRDFFFQPSRSDRGGTVLRENSPKASRRVDDLDATLAHGSENDISNQVDLDDGTKDADEEEEILLDDAPNDEAKSSSTSDPPAKATSPSTIVSGSSMMDDMVTKQRGLWPSWLGGSRRQKERIPSVRNLMEQVAELRLRCANAISEKDNMEHEYEKTSWQLQEARTELTTLRQTTKYLQAQLQDHEEMMEQAVTTERRKAKDELARLKEAMVRVVERERESMRDEFMKQAADLQLLFRDLHAKQLYGKNYMPTSRKSQA